MSLLKHAAELLLAMAKNIKETDAAAIADKRDQVQTADQLLQLDHKLANMEREFKKCR